MNVVEWLEMRMKWMEEEEERKKKLVVVEVVAGEGLDLLLLQLVGRVGWVEYRSHHYYYCYLLLLLLLLHLLLEGKVVEQEVCPVCNGCIDT